MSRRGLQLVLVAVLGLVVWTLAGADIVRAAAAEGSGTSAEELAVHRPGDALGSRAAVLVPAPHDRPGSAARVQRLATVVAVLVAGAIALRSPSADRRGHGTLPVWSGWFADPGRLRGPPAV